MTLTVDGLVIRTQEETNEEFEVAQRDAFGIEVETGSDSVIGNLNAVFSRDIRTVEELVQAVYDSFDDRFATGASLERISAYTGTFRRAATSSFTELDVTADAGTSIDPGLGVFATSGPTQRRFINVDAIVNPGPGQAVLSITVRSEETGPVEAAAGSITVIAEPAPGVVSVTNPADAVLGEEVETDAELRTRRVSELARPGVSTVDAIRADVSDALTDPANNVVPRDVVVFENDADVTDGDGRPPHSVEVLVDDGTPTGTLITDAQIAQAVFDARPGGIATTGNDGPEDAFDSRGVARPTEFSRPVIVPVEVEVTITRGPQWSPTVDTAIEDGLAEFVTENVGIGEDLILSRLSAVILGIPGVCEGIATPEEVTDVTLVRAAIIPAALSTANVPAGPRDKITLDAADVTVLP